MRINSPNYFGQKRAIYISNKISIYVFPEKEQSQFPHAFVCERFIYSRDRSTYFPAPEYADRSWEYINRTQTHAWGNWDCSRAGPFLGIYVSNFRYSISLQYARQMIHMLDQNTNRRFLVATGASYHNTLLYLPQALSCLARRVSPFLARVNTWCVAVLTR